MATLVALIYDNQTTADETFETVKGLQQAGYMKVLEQSVLTKDEHGKINHDHEKHPLRSGVVGGLILGGLTGLIFTIPVFGLVLGGVFGTMIGKWRKSGGGDDFEHFRKHVSEDLKPGGSAVLLLVQTEGPDRVINELGKHGGKVYSTDLTDEQIAEIQHEVDRVASQQ